MDIRKFAIDKLNEMGHDSSMILLKYAEPWRFYHNFDHIISMISSAIDLGILSDELFLAIVYHDIVYDPKRSDNEELSAEFYTWTDGISLAILETKAHVPTTELSEHLCMLDLEVLNGNMKTFMEFEHKIFKEYQFVDYGIYREKRLEILEKLGVNSERLDYVRNRKVNIGIMAGSFNPFHKGHYNILLKAENIFDKVIICRGINSDKLFDAYSPLPNKISYRQTESYTGLLTDFIDSLEYDVTVIRGLRNATDLQYEMTQYRFLQDLKPDMKIVSLFCDKEYEHISSSAVRMLSKYNKEHGYIL